MPKQLISSIEKFAAYLDGNLSQSELKLFSQMAEHDDTLQELLNASSVVDDTIAAFSDTDLQLPPEIADSSFEIPTIPAEGIPQLFAFPQESIDELLVASPIPTEEEIPQITTTISDEIKATPINMDSSVNLLQEDKGIDGGNNLEEM